MKVLFASLLVSVFTISALNARLISTDVVIDADSRIDSEVLEIVDTVKFHNYGVISSDIVVCEMCDVVLRNSGSITSNVLLKEDARLVQVISDAGDINKVNVNGNYSVFVDSKSPVSLDSIIRMASNADKIILNNATVDISGLSGASNANIELVGEVKFVSANLDAFDDGVILENITGKGTAQLLVYDADDFYNYTVSIRGGQLSFTENRETDIDKIIDDIGGDNNKEFWEELYENKENAEIIDALDAAPDEEAFKDIMRQSVLFNPDLLRRPLEIVHAFDVANVGHREHGIYLAPSVITNNDSIIYFADAGIGFDVADNLNLRIDVRVGTIDVENDFDLFGGDFFGGNLAINYMPDSGMFVRMGVGGMWTNFDIGDALYDNHVLSNPGVLSGYAVLDSGVRFEIAKSWYLMPFVGVNGSLYNIDDIRLDDVSLRGGIGVAYAAEILGIRYQYEMNAFGDTNDTIAASMGIDVSSPIDMIGGKINLGITNISDVTSYKISVMARFMF